MSALMHMQPIFYDTHPAGKVVWRGEEPAMRKRLITLIAAMLSKQYCIDMLKDLCSFERISSQESVDFDLDS